MRQTPQGGADWLRLIAGIRICLVPSAHGRHLMQLALLLAASLCAAPAEEDLNSIRAQPGERATATIFYSSLQQQAYAALDRRQAAYEELKTEEQIKAYQERLRKAFVEH